jgi:hypothetical protein
MSEMDPPIPPASEPVPQPPAAPPAGSPAWQSPPPPAQARGSRPVVVTIAGIVLIVIGALVSLFGLLAVLGGALIGTVRDNAAPGVDLGGMQGAIGGVVAFIGAIVLLFGLVELLSGVFALLGRPWARITGIVVSVLGGLFSALGVISAASQGTAGSLVFSVVLLVAYIFVAWGMATEGPYFAGRSAG